MSDYIGRCAAGHAVRATAQDVNAGGGWVACGCGRSTAPRALKAKRSTRECSGVCTASVGPTCSCRCAGENHGAAKIYHPTSTTN